MYLWRCPLDWNFSSLGCWCVVRIIHQITSHSEVTNLECMIRSCKLMTLLLIPCNEELHPVEYSLLPDLYGQMTSCKGSAYQRKSAEKSVWIFSPALHSFVAWKSLTFSCLKWHSALCLNCLRWINGAKVVSEIAIDHQFRTNHNLYNKINDAQ